MSALIHRNSSVADPLQDQQPVQQPTPLVRRRMFRLWGSNFSCPRRITEAVANLLSSFLDGFVYLLGPFLIVFATVIISGLAFTYFFVIVPMMERANADIPWGFLYTWLHTAFVCFILTNVIFNYVACVLTRNKGKNFNRVVRELAVATSFVYPETNEEVIQSKRDFEERMMFRMQRRQERAQVSSEGGAHAPLRGWMILGPHEWAFCNYTNQPKPPRSHYDHITKVLVLNMDHFCPWMFNTVGYFNYRYFCNFLLFVFWGMAYGTYITFKPFNEISSKTYWKQIRQKPPVILENWVPTEDQRTPIAFSFMLCLSVGLAVLVLGGFHAYLVLTSQTTIEFHGNCANKRKAKQLKRKWRNPYDLGLYRNFQQVYGARNPFLAIIVPSLREPEFLPVPIPGDTGRRHLKGNEETEGQEMSSLTNGRYRYSDTNFV